MKLGSRGTILWTLTEAKASLCGGMWGRTPLAQDAAGNRIVVGAEFTSDSSNWNPLLLIYSPNGTTLLRKVFNLGPYASFDAVALDASSGMYVVAHNNPNNGYPHVVHTLKYRGATSRTRRRQVKPDPTGAGASERLAPGPVQSGLPLPDSLTIPVNLTDPVERDPPKLPGFIQEFKSAALTRGKHNLLKWDPVDRAFHSIKIANLKPALAKLLVVTDAAQEFVDRRHAGPTVSGQSRDQS